MAEMAFSSAVPIAYGASAYTGNSFISREMRKGIPVAPMRSRSASIRMGANSAILEKKKERVNLVKEHLSNSEMIFSVPLPGLKVSDVYKLKKSLPEGTVAMTVKNTLMRRAIADSEWEVAGEIVNDSSLWFFVGNDVKGSVNAYTDFARGLQREESVRGGVMEGQLCDAAGISAIAALPSKIELIAQIARLVRMVPTKLGRSVKLVPTKLGRAIKLAFAEDSSDKQEAATEEA